MGPFRYLSHLALSSTFLVLTESKLSCTPDSFSTYLSSAGHDNATVLQAVKISNGDSFEVPASDIAYPQSPTDLPELCVVQLNVTSSATSAYTFGLFLPTEWNERFLAVGNGGFAGGINWADMGVGARYGFASMSTDTGHNSVLSDGSWAYNEPERLIDWGYRAMHGSVVLAKEVTAQYYGEELKYNYYSGCSTGGRQGLRSVELYPDDFDGVIAGAPAWWTSHMQPWTVKIGTYNAEPTSQIPESMFDVIGEEIIRQCDPQDGLVDRIVSAPQQCNVRLETLLCQGTNATQCLSPAQLGTLRQIYSDYVDVNQTFVFPHLLPGSEAEWALLVNNGTSAALGIDYVRYFLGLGKQWSQDQFDYSTVQLADQLDPGNATADDFDISPFHHKGGKLLMYHGMSDGWIPTDSSLYFYNHVAEQLVPRGIDLDSFYRFFYVPGMQHCTGTPQSMHAPWYFAGPNQAPTLSSSLHSVPEYMDARHDILLALMQWVENGTAPEPLIATTWQNDTTQDTVYRQRPLCFYPQKAVYTGEGDAKQAKNWECRSQY
ncbi:tannase and feruloyl esterase [Aspergillus homomorphus CBS 101889]|uniref:Carboxylic ester hydrolase n=1 Tax=Aspergillus homomorphus (strain CBS 101889) TaxID=1450537 RepID=A0A395HLJ3_ASPHC|nr:tannase and feruloyl esterase [Aspergillus homomorphus CBS 101889]RAL07144.1 tannase and feruloyl esterase [Aspergillus homomorphus CBS 101889]